MPYPHSIAKKVLKFTHWVTLKGVKFRITWKIKKQVSARAIMKTKCCLTRLQILLSIKEPKIRGGGRSMKPKKYVKIFKHQGRGRAWKKKA